MKMIIHIVKTGESLYQIARRYGIPVDRIVEDNDIADPARLVVGQALLIRQETTQYIVQPGTRFSESPTLRFPSSSCSRSTIWGTMQSFTPATLDIVYDNLDKTPMEINGFVYPNVEMDVLRRYLPYLTYLSIFSYQIRPGGNLSTLNEEALISEAYRYNVAPLMVVTNIERPASSAAT